jgi:hypothetical protein
MAYRWLDTTMIGSKTVKIPLSYLFEAFLMPLINFNLVVNVNTHPNIEFRTMYQFS